MLVLRLDYISTVLTSEKDKDFQRQMFECRV